MSSTSPFDKKNSGVQAANREQFLLDDPWIEIARLTDAVERQNELLTKSDESGGEPET